jgi:hypothetical protein
MKAIRTRFLGPSYARGSRIKASIDDGDRKEQITIGLETAQELSVNQHWDDVHKTVAKELAKVMKWEGEIVGGVYKNDYYWVFV